MTDIVALGECLIDFTPAGKTDRGIPLYSQNPGGAPANVLAMASKLGAHTAFIGKVGKDSFGQFLENNIKKAGVDTSNLIMDTNHPTTLAFVSLTDTGDRSFSFYRDASADVSLEENDIKSNLLSNAKVFHFGSVSMTSDPSKSATVFAAKMAKENGSIISYDPNYRPLLWKSQEDAKEVLSSVINLADIIKVSDEEMTLITGETDLIKGSEKILKMGPSIVVVTMGSKGSFIRNGSYTKLFCTFDVKTIDTTGAGDAFWGAFLYKLFVENPQSNKEKLQTITNEELNQIMVFANAAGSLTTTKFGAIPAMPSQEEINACLKENRLIS